MTAPGGNDVVVRLRVIDEAGNVLGSFKQKLTETRAGLNGVGQDAGKTTGYLDGLGKRFEHVTSVSHGSTQGFRMVKSSIAAVALESAGLEGKLGRITEGMVLFSGGSGIMLAAALGLALTAGMVKLLGDNAEISEKKIEGFRTEMAKMRETGAAHLVGQLPTAHAALKEDREPNWKEIWSAGIPRFAIGGGVTLGEGLRATFEQERIRQKTDDEMNLMALRNQIQKSHIEGFGKEIAALDAVKRLRSLTVDEQIDSQRLETEIHRLLREGNLPLQERVALWGQLDALHGNVQAKLKAMRTEQLQLTSSWGGLLPQPRTVIEKEAIGLKAGGMSDQDVGRVSQERRSLEYTKYLDEMAKKFREVGNLNFTNPQKIRDDLTNIGLVGAQIDAVIARYRQLILLQTGTLNAASHGAAGMDTWRHPSLRLAGQSRQVMDDGSTERTVGNPVLSGRSDSLAEAMKRDMQGNRTVQRTQGELRGLDDLKVMQGHLQTIGAVGVQAFGSVVEAAIRGKGQMVEAVTAGFTQIAQAAATSFGGPIAGAVVGTLGGIVNALVGSHAAASRPTWNTIAGGHLKGDTKNLPAWWQSVGTAGPWTGQVQSLGQQVNVRIAAIDPAAADAMQAPAAEPMIVNLEVVGATTQQVIEQAQVEIARQSRRDVIRRIPRNIKL